MGNPDPALSIVVPVFNEEANVSPLCERVVAALGDTVAWELILVDDGSIDATVERVEALVQRDSRVKLVQLRRNAGQTPAMVAGIEHARGATIVTMDGDLQNDPADIPRFIEAIDQDYDIVVGWRERRQDKLVTRKIPSWIANRLIGYVTGVPIRDNGCSLKAYRARIIKNVPLYSEMHRFIPAIMSVAGARILEIPVRHHPRIHGVSKYGLKRIYKVILDLLVIRTLLSSIGSPLRYFGKLAILPTVVGLALLIGTVSELMQSGSLNLVLFGAALVWLSLPAFCLFCGVIGELTYRTNERKEQFLASLTSGTLP